MNEHIINNEIKDDFLLSQLTMHLSELEKNTKIFDNLNKKFIAFSQE